VSAQVATLDDVTHEQRDTPRFSKTLELHGGAEPFRGILYPAPTMYDIDGDGQEELVIGDLRGFVYVSERLDDGSFAAKQQLKVSGQPLKFHNW
jgi:hypothetical protein